MRVKSHRGLTLERHIHIGKRLYEMQTELGIFWEELGVAYPKSSRCIAAMKAMAGMNGHFNKLRSELDDSCFQEHHQLSSKEIYYPRKTDHKSEADKSLDE